MARHIILGMGQTGMAFAHCLAQNNIEFEIADTRSAPAHLDQVRQLFPEVKIHLGEFDSDLLEQTDTFYMSPGLDPNTEFFNQARAAGVRLCGDVEFFKHHAKAPIIAITGTNGKSTVTAWLNHMCSLSNKQVLMGGNIGIPTLELLTQPVPDFYILELSSFQLELSEPLHFYAGCITNITSDHLDRHGTLAEYQSIKHRIYSEHSVNVFNLDDVRTYPNSEASKIEHAFSTERTEARFHVAQVNDVPTLMIGNEPLISAHQLSLSGKQNWQNALAVIALADCMKIERAAMVEGLTTFSGLPHRCQVTRTLHDVTWINDSKGTNVGASIAAIEGIAAAHPKSPMTIILGGQGKGADFTPLADAVKAHCQHAIVFGEDADLISSACQSCHMPIIPVKDLSEAIKVAYTETKAGGIVLFSPACASFDMFNNFMARGDYFMEEVNKLQ